MSSNPAKRLFLMQTLNIDSRIYSRLRVCGSVCMRTACSCIIALWQGLSTRCRRSMTEIGLGPKGWQNRVPDPRGRKKQNLLDTRSPRWTSGSPRMLLVLIREFESRRCEILIFFAKKKEERINCWERLAWVRIIRRESTREEIAEIFSR